MEDAHIRRRLQLNDDKLAANEPINSINSINSINKSAVQPKGKTNVVYGKLIGLVSTTKKVITAFQHASSDFGSASGSQVAQLLLRDCSAVDHCLRISANSITALPNKLITPFYPDAEFTRQRVSSMASCIENGIKNTGRLGIFLGLNAVYESTRLAPKIANRVNRIASKVATPVNWLASKIQRAAHNFIKSPYFTLFTSISLGSCAGAALGVYVFNYALFKSQIHEENDSLQGLRLEGSKWSALVGGALGGVYGGVLALAAIADVKYHVSTWNSPQENNNVAAYNERYDYIQSIRSSRVRELLTTSRPEEKLKQS